MSLFFRAYTAACTCVACMHVEVFPGAVALRCEGVCVPVIKNRKELILHADSLIAVIKQLKVSRYRNMGFGRGHKRPGNIVRGSSLRGCPCC